MQVQPIYVAVNIFQTYTSTQITIIIIQKAFSLEMLKNI